ncbi:hypothetical protein [Candidatus Oleimmundimicrobium sp.]|uniref:hypothetical protein n=1 Tax=Candidatus Oleimmundimicrobium sp. TaxID=3060597 RepID=UPI002719BBB3|nr:hypothetical protein [Candidatus Oleimmundimicrobium sp.]MDO8885374.1 hypothetical protein [Candidatus Oleimmundimicrobium sp.]
MFKGKESKTVTKNSKATINKTFVGQQPKIFNREKQEYAQLMKFIAISKQIIDENFSVDKIAEKVYQWLKKYYKNKEKVLLKLNNQEQKILLNNLKKSDSEECKRLASIIEIETRISK